MKSANLQLTLACLSFLKLQCVEPIAKLFPKRPVESESDEVEGDEANNMELLCLRSKNPFLEYACFSWMVHLIDCTSMEALEVSRAFYGTFNSPSTFGWIESCMTLLPESITRLLIGLEDARDWFHEMQSNCIHAADLRSSFALKWCATMEQVLGEYSPVIQARPAELYYLDLAYIFAAHKLTNMYQEYGGQLRREKCSRFPTDEIQRSARKKVPSCRQLPISADECEYEPLLFIYEPIRDIYLWSYEILPYGNATLLAQSAKSGRRLPPVRDLEVWSDFQNSLEIVDYAMSGNGRYIGITYRYPWSDYLLTTTIWEIEETLEFTRRIQSSSWARLIHRSTVKEPSLVRLWSKHCIAFDQNDVCYTPNGLVRTVSGASTFIPNNPVQRLSESITESYSDVRQVLYSGNGKFLFVFFKTKFTKYTFPDLEVQSEMSLSEETDNISKISPSGRYLAFVLCDQRYHEDLTRSNRVNLQQPTLLVDTTLGNSVVLPDSADATEGLETYDLHFSLDERELVACYISKLAGSWTVRVYSYTGLPGQVCLKASGKCRYNSVQQPIGVHVSDDHRISNVIIGSGEIQRIRLGDEIEFLDTPDELKEYPLRSTFLSQDASQFACLYYGSNNAHVHIYTMLRPTEMPRCIELRRESFLKDEGPTFIAMSMDLSILIIDGSVYSLRNSKIGQILIPLQTLKIPEELECGQSTFGDPQPQCFIDPTNSYVVYLKRNQSNNEQLVFPDTLALFRINVDECTSLRLQPSLPEGMYDIASQFHPSLPLLLIGFRLISEANSLMSPIDIFPVYVIIIDMSIKPKRAAEIEPYLEIYSGRRFVTDPVLLIFTKLTNH